MGLLKDIYEILKKDRDAFNQIKEGTLKLIEISSRKFFKKKLTLSEKRELYLSLSNELTKEELSDNFKDYFEYFSILLGLIVDSTSSFDKGCLLKDFFSSESKYSFFFPSPSQDLRLIKKTNPSGQKNCYFESLDSDIFGEKRRYNFYAIEKKNIDFSDLKNSCEKIRRQSKNELNFILKYLKDNKIKYEELTGLSESYDKNGYEFLHSYKLNLKELKLSFERPEESKKYIREDLIELINFKLI